jgi:hypothetical protein
LTLPDSGNPWLAGQRGKTYRTVCVRLCDGYFYPVSFATTGDRFERDEETCARSCASPARLYVYANPGEEPENMVSVSGQPYSKLPTAFQFRTKFDAACKCAPNPWEPEAMDRHRRTPRTRQGRKRERQAPPSLLQRLERSVQGEPGHRLGAVEAACAMTARVGAGRGRCNGNLINGAQSPAMVAFLLQQASVRRRDRQRLFGDVRGAGRRPAAMPRAPNGADRASTQETAAS